MSATSVGSAFVENETVLKSRRAVLGAALGGAAVAAAASVARPLSVNAATSDPAVIGVTNQGTDPTTFQNTDAGENSLQAVHDADGTAFYAESVTGAGVFSRVVGTDPTAYGARSTGVVSLVGSTSNAATNSQEVGVYGFADTSPSAVGVWGDSVQGIGLYGTGDWGLYAYGNAGAIGDSQSTGVGIYGFSGDNNIPAPDVTGVGVYARAGTAAKYALYVQGKARFSRSGRVSIGATASSKSVTMSGVTTSSWVIATLQTSVSGVYVRAVVPASGSFKIYLSKAPGKTVAVGYMVIN